MPTYLSQLEHFAGTLEMKTLLQRTKGETRRGVGLVNINAFKKLERNVTTNALIIKRYGVEGRLIVFCFQ